jgi:hypothetical protein
MSPGDLVRIRMPWAAYHDTFAFVIRLCTYDTATVLTTKWGLRTFDCEVLETIDEV